MHEDVPVRAFRGTRRSSVYREHVFRGRAFERLLEVGERRQLPLTASFRRRGSRDLDKLQARSLAAELDTIRRGLELPDLDDELVSFGELARWCARAAGEAWLRIDRR